MWGRNIFFFIWLNLFFFYSVNRSIKSLLLSSEGIQVYCSATLAPGQSVFKGSWDYSYFSQSAQRRVWILSCTKQFLLWGNLSRRSNLIKLHQGVHLFWVDTLFLSRATVSLAIWREAGAIYINSTFHLGQRKVSENLCSIYKWGCRKKCWCFVH